MASESDCRQAADELLGESLASVVYVRLTDPPWDYGDWHYPELGVQFTTLSGRPFYAIWDDQVTTFELTFAEGRLSPNPEVNNVWDVSDHPRWTPLMSSPITSYRIALGVPDDPPVLAPVAVRFATDSGVAWLVAAGPKDFDHPHGDIRAEDVWVGHCEMIVLFDDVRAERLGLREGDGTPRESETKLLSEIRSVLTWRFRRARRWRRRAVRRLRRR